MAGSDPGFSASEFRDAIQFAMKMGAPNDEAKQATFKWAPQRTYAAANPSDSPYDWSAAPVTSTTSEDVTLDEVAIEFAAITDGAGTPMGRFDESRGVLTLLDEQYAQVSTANRVVYGGRSYLLQEATPVGLFDVTVWQIPITEGDVRS